MKKTHLLAKDDPRFMKWYQPEYNPDINLETLEKWDNEQILIHIYENGYVQRVTADSLFKHGTWNRKKQGVKIQFAKDDPRFLSWFQPEYNPGVDPYTLEKYDKKIILTHVYDGWIVQRQTAKSLFSHNFRVPKHVHHTLAKDDPRFLAWFQEEYNPDVDIDLLKKLDTKQKLIHVYENGFVQVITAKTLYSMSFKTPKRAVQSNVAKRKHTPRPWRGVLATSKPEFNAWFQPEYNEGVDLENLYTRDKEPELVHVYENGIIQRIMPLSLFISRSWTRVRKRESGLAKDSTKFMKWFQREYNPDIDLEMLRKYDKETILMHVERNGSIRMVTPYVLFHTGLWHKKEFELSGLAKLDDRFMRWFQPENNTDVDLDILMKNEKRIKLVHIYEDGTYQVITPLSLFVHNNWDATKSKRRYVLAVSDPRFREWFQEEHNPHIRLDTLFKSDSKQKLVHIDEYGRRREVTAQNLFTNQRWELPPPGQFGGSYGWINAIEMDPDLELFTETLEDQEFLEHCKMSHRKVFTCPLCDNQFEAKVGDMIGKHPKCPYCNDTGNMVYVDDLKVEGSFLRHTNTIRERKKNETNTTD